MPGPVIPPGTALYRALAEASERRCVVFAGLPGTGKSLLTQQCTAIADAPGARSRCCNGTLPARRLRPSDQGAATARSTALRTPLFAPR